MTASEPKADINQTAKGEIWLDSIKNTFKMSAYDQKRTFRLFIKMNNYYDLDALKEVYLEDSFVLEIQEFDEGNTNSIWRG